MSAIDVPPGLERPVRTLEHVRRFSGQRVSLTAHDPHDGRRNFEGILLGPDGERHPGGAGEGPRRLGPLGAGGRLVDRGPRRARVLGRGAGEGGALPRLPREFQRRVVPGWSL
ncbi:MAG: hypothetical protein DYH06_13245 [Acidobacteria bacterium ACB2]|nr:hypothetical protein [Acidobacteria bacterium ACB2]